MYCGVNHDDKAQIKVTKIATSIQNFISKFLTCSNLVKEPCELLIIIKPSFFILSLLWGVRKVLMLLSPLTVPEITKG